MRHLSCGKITRNLELRKSGVSTGGFIEIGAKRIGVPGAKRPGHETRHSYPFSREVKNTRVCSSALPFVFLAQWLYEHGYTFSIASLRRKQAVNTTRDTENFLNLSNDKPTLR